MAWTSKKVADGTDVDELLDSLGVAPRETGSSPGAVPPRAGDRGDEPDGWGGSRLPFTLAAALGVVVLLALAAFWFGRSSSDETATAADGGVDTVVPAEESTDLGATAAEVQVTLDRLGFNGVMVDVGDSTVQLTGTVPSERDVSELRSVLLASADVSVIDMSGVEVAAAPVGPADASTPAPGTPAPAAPGPGGQPPAPAAGTPAAAGGTPPPAAGTPPPGFVLPTLEQQAELQQELNRVLTDTPLVFDTGSVELNELQLEVLVTVIIPLLEAHPGVPVRLVGYTDETGDDYSNDLLSIERAKTVRDYLISSGVPEFIVRAEGRGEQNASGDAGADRRVEIEVIETSGP